MMKYKNIHQYSVTNASAQHMSSYDSPTAESILNLMRKFEAKHKNSPSDIRVSPSLYKNLIELYKPEDIPEDESEMPLYDAKSSLYGMRVVVDLDLKNNEWKVK